jgi:hypothetical protein
MVDVGSGMRKDRRGTRDEKKVIQQIRSVRDLEVYQLAFYSAMEIFKLTKTFPPKNDLL